MKNWYAALSAAQKRWLYATVLFLVTVITLSVLIKPEQKTVSLEKFTLKNNLKQTARMLGVTGKSMARELGLPLSTPKTVPLGELGVKQEKLQHAAEHLLSHKDTMGKYFIYAALVLAAFVFLLRLGKPDNAPHPEKGKWYPRLPYIIALLLAVVFTGFALGKSPNPMEGIVKVFKSMVGLYPDPAAKTVAFFFFLVLALVGNKLICGWACPLGALQELFYSIPILRNIKKRKLPFWFTNGIRAAVFILMLLFLFAVIGGKKGFVLYHFVNAFDLFNFDFDTISIIIAIAAAAFFAFFTYRPYCSMLCPFGFVSWLFEKASVVGVRIDYNACTKCGACSRACPNQSAGDRVENKAMPADCFSCMRCLDTCPTDAIRYGKRKK